MKQTVSPITLRLHVLLLTAALWLGIGLSNSAHAGDVSLVILTKGQAYHQTTATTTILAPNSTNGLSIETPFSIYAFVQGTDAITNVTAFNVLSPEEGVEFLPEDGQFVYQEYALNNAELEEFLPPGNYSVNITAGESNHTATLNVPTTAAYPNIPKLLNWADAQHVDSLANFTLQWTPMTGGNAHDFIYVNISEEGLFELDGEGGFRFASPFIGETNQLTGQSNSIVIPAGTFLPGRTYRANITFVNFPAAGLSTNAIPGARVGVGFVRETEVTIAIGEVPPQGRIQFTAPHYFVDETNGTVEIHLVRLGGSEGEVSIRLATANLSATAGADYTAYDQQLSFEPGATNLTITIPITDDFLLEGFEDFRLGLSNPQGGVQLSIGTNTTVAIHDNETSAAGKLTFSAATYQVIEGPTNTVKVIVRRESGTTGDVGGTIQIYGGTADIEDDYDATPGETMTFSIPAGKNSATNLITINDDEEAEGSETILLRLESPTGGATLGRIGTNTITILDDENAFAFEVARSTNVENHANAVITILRTGSTLEAASVDYAVSIPELGFAPAVDAPYATTGVDFLGATGTIVFPKGVAKKNFMVKILDDLSLEGDEAIVLTLRNETNAQLGELSSALLYIKDNDLAGTVSFVMTNQNVRESVGSAKIMVIRTGGFASNIMVRLSTQAGTATDGLDYQGFTSNLVFSGKEVKKTIPLSVFQDAIVESTENLTLTLSTFEITAAGDFTPASQPGQYAGLGDKTNLTVNIADDDLGGTITFDKVLQTVNESVTNFAIILKRTGGLASNVTVRLQSANGATNPATAGSDYFALDTVVTFGPGELRKTNALHIINDTVADALLPEIIALTLRDYTGGAKPGASNAFVAIIDDESSVSFASATSSGVENKTVTITVARGGFLGSTSTVEYMFMDGTATNGVDFTGTAGTLTFKPRELLKTIIVPIATDPNVESTRETFTIILKDPTGALLGDIITNTVSITDAPAVGAIRAEGAAFFKATIRGIDGNTLSKTIDIGSNGLNVVVSSVSTNLGWITSLNGLNNKFTLGGGNVRVLNNWLQFINLHAAAPGIVNVGGDQANGGITWFYSDTTTPIGGSTTHINEIHTYVSGRAGTTGTVTIDVLDTEAHVIAGRFDYTALDDDGGKKVRIMGSFRSTGTVVN